jgi:hypothetical protein
VHSARNYAPDTVHLRYQHHSGMNTPAPRRDGTGRLLEDEPLPYLGAWRRHLSWSQRALAASAHLDASTLHRLELLGSPARPSTVRALASALGITPSELRRQPPA